MCAQRETGVSYIVINDLRGDYGGVAYFGPFDTYEDAEVAATSMRNVVPHGYIREVIVQTLKSTEETPSCSS